jgi:hypothetical protein
MDSNSLVYQLEVFVDEISGSHVRHNVHGLDAVSFKLNFITAFYFIISAVLKNLVCNLRQ